MPKTLSVRIAQTNAPLLEITNSLEIKAQRDFDAHKGRILLVNVVTGYNSADDSVDILLNPPARMRVCLKINNEDLQHWVDNWLDPYWDVDLIGEHPALADIRSMWVYGPSYCTDGRTEPSSDWALEPTISQRIVALFRRTR